MVNSENLDRSVVLGGLPQDVTTNKVEQLFAAFQLHGKITFLQDEFGVKKGYAIVHLENSIQAQRAIAELNGKYIGGRYITIKKATKVYDPYWVTQSTPL